MPIYINQNAQPRIMLRPLPGGAESVVLWIGGTTPVIITDQWAN